MSRVALIGDNSIGYVHTLLDIWNNGDCAVLLDWRIPFSTALEMMIEAEVHVCYVEKNLFEKLANEIPDSIHFIPYEEQNNSAELLPNCIYDRFQENYSRNEAVVIYSSGTTGKSKGIVLSHYVISTNADAIIDYMLPSENDCIYITRSLTHSSTLTGELLVALKTKTKVLISPVIVPPRYTLTNIYKFGITIIGTNPNLLSMYCDECCKKTYDLTSLKRIYVSGSILPAIVYEAARKTFFLQKIYNVYGLTELGPRVCAQREGCCHGNSVGKPITGVSICVIDENGNRATQGEIGIIHVKTPSKFSGYVTGKNKHKSLYHDWFNTGDMGFIDIYKELHIVGRSDDMIIINSHKIYPSDIEQKILSTLNFIECVVTSIDVNNTEQLCCLYVTGSSETIEFQKSLYTVLMRHEIPKLFIKTDSIPKNENGKVLMQSVKKFISTNIEMRETYESQ